MAKTDPPAHLAAPDADDPQSETGVGFRRLAEQGRDVFFRFRLGAEPVLEYVSPAAFELTGYTPAELRDVPGLWQGLVHPDDRPQVPTVADPAGRSAEAISGPVNLRLVHRDGSVRWIEQRSVPVRDASGTLVGTEGVARDISAEIEARDRLRASEARMRDLLSSIGLGALMLDPQLRVEFVNDVLLEWLGRTRDEVLGRDWVETSIPEREQDDVRNALETAIRTGRPPASREDGLIARDGEHRLLWTNTIQRGPQGEVIGLAAIAQDVTQTRRVEAERARLAAAIEQSAESVVITDRQGLITYVNRAFETISGYASAEVIGQNPRLLKSGVQSATFYDAMWAALSAGLPWVADIVNRRKDGELYHLDAVISPIRDPDGAITGFVNVGRDVSHERELESAMASLMRERALIAETLDSFRLLAPDHEQNLESTADLFCRQVASLSNVVVAVLLALDSDSAAVPLAFIAPGGADVGLRRLPAESARELQERATVGPWVARTSAARGHPYLEGLQHAGVRAMAYAPVRSGNRLIGVLGIGSAQSDAMAQLSAQLGALVEFADLAGALLGHRVAERRHDLRLQHELEQIIAERAFWPVFQPIVDLRSRRIIGYEALTRFADGTRPDLRFDSAAEVGLGLELEQATLESAIEAAAALPPARWAQFNVSPELVMADGILAPLLLRAGKRVVLEVTEHTAIPDYGKFRDALGGLGRRVYLAVDDAGAGFASLRHILELNPTFVKLDYSLVHGIDGDRARQALVAGMQHFARTSRRRLVAEGVETEAEAAILSDLGIRLAQGYLFGRPAALPD